MQIAQDTNVLETNAKFERQNFGVGDMAIVMELLSKLYANPIQTLTQEYICNGRDANRESKTKKPLEITVPTRFSPTLKIRDYGLGLTPERISSVFLLYGNSTKRTNNKQTGGFGIGAKSAWSYTDSFNITTYVDGIMRTYIAHKSSGSGNLDLISEVKTSEPNGTCIEIAVKQNDTSLFKKAVLRATYFWSDKETPTLHGISEVEKELVTNDFSFGNIQLYKNLPSFLADYGYQHFAVIDGIPYKMPNQLQNINSFGKLTNVVKSNILCFLNTGDIEIAPSREELVINDNTQQVLADKVFIPAKQLVDKFILDKKNKAKTIQQSLEVYKELGETFEIQKSWGNWSIRSWNNNQLEHRDWKKGAVLKICETVDDRIKKEKLNALPISQIGVVFYIDTKESPLITNKRFRTLLNQNVGDIYQLDTPTQEMITDLKAVKLSTIATTEKPKTATILRTSIPLSKRQIMLHRLHNVEISWSSYEWRAKPEKRTIGDIKTQTIYIPMDHPMADAKNRHNYSALFRYVGPIYLIAVSRVGLIADNKYFIHIDDYIKGYKLSKHEKNQLMANEIEMKHDIAFLKGHTDTLKDKHLADIVDMALLWDRDKQKVAPEILSKNFIESKSFKAFKTKAKKVTDSLSSKYPLIFGISIDDKKACVEYMNFIHNKGI